MLNIDIPESKSQISYVDNDTLDKFADVVVNDFAPEYMQEPKPLDTEHFTKDYLKLNIAYARISSDRQTSGMIAFDNGAVQVINEHTGEPELLPVSAGTVIIEPTLMKPRYLPRMRFTLMHEASHWLLHRQAYTMDDRLGNHSKRIERQADFLASALLMPREPLRLVLRDFFKLHNEPPHRLVRGNGTIDDVLAIQLPRFTATRFGVSQHAALIRLEKLDAIAGKPMRSQYTG
ncbi:hypothetical protein FACS1894105_03780 [Clostridia bacterium]|nr:hypothetical protein FACS1894105_03780 [Clostridia bacterium]